MPDGRDGRARDPYVIQNWEIGDHRRRSIGARVGMPSEESDVDLIA